MSDHKTKYAIIALCAVALSGCSGGQGLSTGSLFGGEKKTAAKPAETLVRNDPTSRAMQVGAASARAVKCGYNFDPAKLKANYLASEAALGAPVAQIASIEKTYDIMNRSVIKAIASKKGYCTERKIETVKKDLTRHLAGDYTSKKPKKVAVANDGGLFGIFDGDVTGEERGPKYGSQDWWDKQAEDVKKN